MIDIDKLIENVTALDYSERTRRSDAWLDLLVDSKKDKAIYLRDHFVFIGIDMDDNLQKFIDLELVTEDAFHFTDIPDEVIDNYCKSLLIMYEIVDDTNGLPIISMYVPNKVVPENIKDIIAASMITMYKVKGFTTDSSCGDDKIQIE